MPLAWHELHHRLVQSSSSLRFQQQFAALRAAHPALQCFRDPAALLDHLHRGASPPDRKNTVLRALISAAQGEDDNSALTLMLLALWPGLDAVRRRLNGRRYRAGSEPAADLLSRACEAIRTLNLERVMWIAATVLRNVERDTVRQMQREAQHQALQAAVEPDSLPSCGVFDDPLIGGLIAQRALDLLTGHDAELVAQVAVEGRTQAEAGVALGLSEAAARKRFQRATHQLRQTMH